MMLPTRMPGRWTLALQSYTWFDLPIFVSGDKIAVDCGGKMHRYSMASVGKAKAYYLGPEFSFCDPCLGIPN